MMDRIKVDQVGCDMYETLNLLRLYNADREAVYFVVSGVAIDDGGALDGTYYYDEHSCPTNYVPVEAIMTANDADPHGVFDYVRSVWKPSDYSGQDEEILRIFPEISAQ